MHMIPLPASEEMRLLKTLEALAVFMLRLTDDFKDAGMCR